MKSGNHKRIPFGCKTLLQAPVLVTSISITAVSYTNRAIIPLMTLGISVSSRKLRIHITIKLPHWKLIHPKWDEVNCKAIADPINKHFWQIWGIDMVPCTYLMHGDAINLDLDLCDDHLIKHDTSSSMSSILSKNTHQVGISPSIYTPTMQGCRRYCTLLAWVKCAWQWSQSFCTQVQCAL